MAELLIPPPLRPRHRAAFARHLASGEATILGRRLELTALRADGAEFPVELSISRTELSGEPFFTGYLRDISRHKSDEEERASLEAQLRHAQKMEAIGRLAGGIAHDFNNLLTVIGGYSDMQLRALPEGGAAREDAVQIKTAAERATALTRQLLVFSRHQAPNLRAVDLNESVSEIEPMLRRVIGEDVELVARLAARPGRVRADPNQIDQVVLNLVVNARDAMPEGGTLTLETAEVELDRAYVESHFAVPLEPGPYAMLAVSDTGVGIDAETQAKIFDPFFTTKGEEEGTGLGLSTVYGIARQSGGAIWVYSEPGHGATFKLYLPRVEAGEEVEGASEPPPEAATARASETVLVVEDEEAVRGLARRILADGGYEVLEAADGAAAIELCERHDSEIHLVLTDMVMPGMGGLELADRLLARRPELRLVVMSGYTERAVDKHDLDARLDFLQKPFSAAALTTKVREALDARREDGG
jgi:signal transduction histidine kinase/ActR/RegA family two-component response regulator